MDRKIRNSVNLKRSNKIVTNTSAVSAAIKSDPFCKNSNVSQATTSMSPLILSPLTKGSTSLKHLHSFHNRITRQRTNNSVQQNNNYKSKAAAAPTITTTTTTMTTTPIKLTHRSETTMANKSQSNNGNTNNNNNNNGNIMNNQTFLIGSKEAACVASPMEQLAAVHAKITSSRNKNEEAINDLRTRIPEIENIFDVHSRIGNGTFSTVLLGTLKKERDLPENQKRKFAIKHHIPTSHPDRIMKELQCMAKIGGSDNVVGINCCIRCNESVAFIMPYLAHDRFHDFYNKMDVSEIQFYMKNLLIALRHVHRFNVIHRDVKPSNFLYNRRKRQFLLVDFGLAQQVATSHMGATTNNLTGTVPNLSLLTPNSVVAGEGKREREQDDIITKKTMDGAAVAVTDADEIVSGTVKRLRCTTPLQQHSPDHLQSEVAIDPTQAANAAKSGTLSHTPFKMPLKQINEIHNSLPIESKGAVARGSSAGKINEHKSASGTAAPTISGRLHQRVHVQGGVETVHHSSKRASSAGGVGGNGKNTPPVLQAANANNSNNNSTDAKYNTNRNSTSTNGPKCYCYGNPQVCNICLVKKEIHASRAGTPGYRPPEVLLKYPDQTTSVDIWAAGVIFLSTLSSVYPFFKAPNDYVALAEMITIFGDKVIRKTAFILDRLVTLSQKTRPLDLRKLCVRFRNRSKFSSPELLKKHQRPNGTCEVCKNCDQYFFNCLCKDSAFVTESVDDVDAFPPSAYDLLYKLLEVNPHKRITADEALQHPFFLECHNNNNNYSTTTSNPTSSPVATSASVQTTAVPPSTPAASLAAAGDSAKKNP